MTSLGIQFCIASMACLHRFTLRVTIRICWALEALHDVNRDSILNDVNIESDFASIEKVRIELKRTCIEIQVCMTLTLICMTSIESFASNHIYRYS